MSIPFAITHDDDNIHFKFSYNTTKDDFYLGWLNNVLNTLMDLNNQMKEFGKYFESVDIPPSSLEEAKKNSIAFQQFLEYIVKNSVISSAHKIEVTISGDVIRPNTSIGVVKKLFSGQINRIMTSTQIENVMRKINILTKNTDFRNSVLTTNFMMFIEIMAPYINKQKGGRQKSRIKKASSGKPRK